MSAPPTAKAKRASMAPLWLLVAIFAAPMIAAWFFYLNPEMLPATRSNRGELVEPPRPLPEMTLPTASGQLATTDLDNHWTMAMVAGAACDAVCEERVHDFRQIRRALAENGERTLRLVLLDPGQRQMALDLENRYPGLRVALPDPATRAAWLPEPVRNPGSVFLVDPMGNVMMRYAQDAPPEDILKDLERLFKASKNWIKGAQYGHK